MFITLSLRAGTVYSIKMLLEHQCAFVNYTRKEDCERAIKCINVCTILIVMTVTFFSFLSRLALQCYLKHLFFQHVDFNLKQRI